MPREVRNMPASVHARLLNLSPQSGRPFQEMLEYYAMERFLYRLSVSPHSQRFVLKGGLMLVAWRSPWVRPTMDVGLLGRMPNELAAVASVMRDVCLQPVEDDGGGVRPVVIAMRSSVSGTSRSRPRFAVLTSSGLPSRSQPRAGLSPGAPPTVLLGGRGRRFERRSSDEPQDSLQ